jgi:hypothetical protein
MTWLKRLLARIPDHYDHVHVAHEVHIHVPGPIYTEHDIRQVVAREIDRARRHGTPD